MSDDQGSKTSSDERIARELTDIRKQLQEISSHLSDLVQVTGPPRG